MERLETEDSSLLRIMICLLTSLSLKTIFHIPLYSFLFGHNLLSDFDGMKNFCLPVVEIWVNHKIEYGESILNGGFLKVCHH